MIETPPAVVSVRKDTPQQEAIYEAIRDGKGNMVVEALAGTGKTTTAVSCLQQVRGQRVGFLAFNAHIARELQDRLPADVPASTLHSLGYAAIRRWNPRCNLDAQKLSKVVKEVCPAGTYTATRIAVESLTRQCKYALIDGTNQDEVADLMDHQGIEIDLRDRSKVFALVPKVLEACKERTQTCDFDDQIWFPHTHQIQPDQFGLLLVDEAQDLNRAQQALARSAAVDGRLCFVGDRNQAIYGFAGADCESLTTLTRELNATTYPLTVTWRCPTSHVRLARRLVPGLQAAPQAVEGVVTTQSVRGIVKDVKPGDLVIGRKNAPVISMTYKLVLAGVPAMMRGRDIGKGLLSLISRLKPDSIEDLIDKVAEFAAKEERRLIKQDAAASSFDALEDRCQCLSKLASQTQSLAQLEQFIQSVFDDDIQPEDCVVLSSVHRAKGLEASTVYVLDPDSLPLRRRDQQPWQAQQEKNLAYIAATRSKHTLVFEDHIPSIFTE